MWTTTTAAVCGPSRLATEAGSRASVAGSQSAKRGVAPAAMTAAAVAWNVLAGTTTSRPVTPTARSTISRALVPDATAMACCTW